MEELLAGPVADAAAGLVGCSLQRRITGGDGRARILQALIIETEAYHQDEPGCHAHRSKTARNAAMFGEPGRLYVYFTYGNWHMLNIVCEPEGIAAAVLIRGLHLTYDSLPPDLALPAQSLRLHGPGLLCKSLEVDNSHGGLSVLDPAGDFYLFRTETLGERPWEFPELEATTRVGFSFQDDRPWRFVWKNHPGLGKVSLKPLARKAAMGGDPVQRRS